MQPSFGPRHYVPLLKGKDGEMKALHRLTLAELPHLTPFIDVPPIPEAGDRPRTPEQHYASQAEKLEKYWGQRGAVFVDSRLVQPGRRTADGKHPAAILFSRTRHIGIEVVPVTGLRREHSYQEAVRDAVGQSESGVCLRIEDADLTERLAEDLAGLLESLGVGVDRTDLVLDFRAVSQEAQRAMALAAGAAIRALPHLDRWRTFTLAAGAFPRFLGELGRAPAIRLPRTDWRLWQRVSAALPATVRRPAFGDYGIAHPDLEDADPRLMTVPVALRYTTPTEFLVLKRGSYRKSGGAPFQKICEEIVRSPDYSGEAFSWGDGYISRTARGEESGGNPEAWRKVATSHHLTLAAMQLRDHPGATRPAP